MSKKKHRFNLFTSEEALPDTPGAAGGGTKKKRHFFRKSKKSKLTKRSRSVRRSRNRKGGMTNSEIKEIKDKIKKLVLDREKKQIDDIAYRANYGYIYSLWRSLGSKENKDDFETEFVKVANTFFTDHRYRVPLYERIIADLRATDKYNESHPTEWEMHKSPPSLEVIYTAGGKSTCSRRHNRRSSKKYKKARKSRRRVRS
jgi:thiamine kinase-like enzyme